MSTFYAKAVKLIKNAEKLEKEGRVAEAAELYRQASALLEKAATYERDVGLKTIYTHLAEQARRKAQELTSYALATAPAPTPTPTAPTPTPTVPPTAPYGAPTARAPPTEGKLGELEREALQKAESFIEKADVTWDDIVGLSDVKKELMEALYFSLAKPELPIEVEVPRRFLLFGPPGTGKTMLAMAASNMLKATFFNVSISGVLSRYVGDSPKIVAAVFELARRKAPSVIFFDEIDAIAIRRDIAADQIPGLLQTLLTELDGFKSKKFPKPIIVIAATNQPWMLDEAILSRFDRRIYVPLPDRQARIELFKLHLEKKGFKIEGITYEELADRTDGYSGRDIRAVCTKAIMMMLRRANPDIESIMRRVRDLKELETIKYRVLPITREELLRAISEVKPAVSKDKLKKYEEWAKEHEAR